MRTLTLAVVVILLSAGQAWGTCYKEDIRGGIDRSLPCFLHSPLDTETARVLFEQDSSELNAKAKAILDRQAEILRGHPNLPLTVWGHVDSHEAKAPNGEALGFKRALAVRDYLVTQGIAPEQITTNSRGNRWIITFNSSEEALADMRFVSTETDENR